MNESLLKIEFYVPNSHLQEVKTAMFEAGAGRVGRYDYCAWQTAGQGQFRPLQGSNPFHGKPGQLEQLEEFKVEMVCAPKFLEAVITAMKKAHPYEEVAYCVIRTVS